MIYHEYAISSISECVCNLLLCNNQGLENSICIFILNDKT